MITTSTWTKLPLVTVSKNACTTKVISITLRFLYKSHRLSERVSTLAAKCNVWIPSVNMVSYLNTLLTFNIRMPCKFDFIHTECQTRFQGLIQEKLKSFSFHVTKQPKRQTTCSRFCHSYDLIIFGRAICNGMADIISTVFFLFLLLCNFCNFYHSNNRPVYGKPNAQ